jgi:hypothetical protein
MVSHDKNLIRRTADTLDLPPIPRRKLGKRKKKSANDRPMTKEERDALRFEAIKVDFDWRNEEWATTWLPWVRLAVAILHLDDEQHKESALKAVQAGLMPKLLEGFTRTKTHLKALHDAVDATLVRSFITVERLGYSPENPPPETPIKYQ